MRLVDRGGLLGNAEEVEIRQRRLREPRRAVQAVVLEAFHSGLHEGAGAGGQALVDLLEGRLALFQVGVEQILLRRATDEAAGEGRHLVRQRA
jgi:hypothetical protein